MFLQLIDYSLGVLLTLWSMYIDMAMIIMSPFNTILIKQALQIKKDFIPDLEDIIVYVYVTYLIILSLVAIVCVEQAVLFLKKTII